MKPPTDLPSTVFPRRRFLGGLAAAGSAFTLPASMLGQEALPAVQPAPCVSVADMVELSAEGVPVEIKEWQAIKRYLQALPAPEAGELPVIPTDARAREQRFIRVG